MSTNTFPTRPIPLGGNAHEEDFSINLGRFIICRMYELKERGNKMTTFDKNIMMMLTYIMFNVSST
jgi:hypothetical protein